MIRLVDLTKRFWLSGRSRVVLDAANAEFPTGASVALLGHNGAGKSTLLQMIAGTMPPTSGEILSTGSISWPVGFAGSFHPELTGAQNVRFVARIYGVDTDEAEDFVRDFAGLGVHYNLPFRSYSSGMRSRLAFGTSMAVPFDTYLVDEVTSVGDAAFREKSKIVFEARRKTSGAVVVSHSMTLVRDMCDMGAVLDEGRLVVYDDLDQAIEHHEANQKIRSAG